MSPARKSARKSAPGRPFAKGGDPRQGRGPAKGHGGRTPDAVKLACLHAFADRVSTLATIADNAGAEDKDRIRALDVLARYAGLAQLDITVQRPVAIEIVGLDG